MRHAADMMGGPDTDIPMRLDTLTSFLFPEQAVISNREKIITALAGFVAMGLVIWATQQLAQAEHRPYMISSMGASAVLLFAVVAAGLLFGFLGVLLAAPLTVVVYVLVQRVYVKTLLGKTIKIAGAD